MADIRALYADEDGNILDAPKGFQALARTGTDIIELSPDDLIPLPESADLMFLPDRLPLAKYGDDIMPIMGNAVAAILPAGYTRLYMPAFKKEDDAIKASEMMIDIGESAGKKVAVVISSMDQPLGRAVGNTLEVMEALDVLKGVGDSDITEISLELAGIMIYMSGIADDLSEGREIASDVLYSGKALDKFRELVKAQGGNSQIIDDYSIFGIARYSRSVEAEDIGYISLLDAETIGKASQLSGAGRVHKEDEIDFQSGIIIYKKLGEQVAEGDKVI